MNPVNLTKLFAAVADSGCAPPVAASESNSKVWDVARPPSNAKLAAAQLRAGVSECDCWVIRWTCLHDGLFYGNVARDAGRLLASSSQSPVEFKRPVHSTNEAAHSCSSRRAGWRGRDKRRWP